VILEDLRIINGKADLGAGIHCNNASLVVRNCTIEACDATSSGGGLYFKSAGTLNVENCMIRGNTAIHKGAGLYIHAASATLADVRNSIVSGNTLTTSGDGGGLCCFFDPLETLDCDLVIEGCTFAVNTVAAGGRGGGVWTEHSTSSTGLTSIRNTILWGNSATLGDQLGVGGGICEVQYSDLQGGLSSVHVEPGASLVPGSGVIAVNPQFQNPLSNFHLKKFSPCINAGNPSYMPLPGETDIDAGERVLDNRVEIGADERYATPAPAGG
jgi:hypothetical protein